MLTLTLTQTRHVILLVSYIMISNLAWPVPARAETPNVDSTPAVNIAIFSFPPHSHLAANNRISGHVVETVRTLCQFAHLDCNFDIFPASRAYLNVETGISDALITPKYARFEKCCIFADWQYKTTLGIYSSLSVDHIPRNEAQMKGKHIILIRGWQSPYQAFPNLDSLISSNQLQVAYSNSVISAVKMFHKKRASLLWGSKNFEWYFEKLSITKNSWNFRQLVTVSSGLWISKHSELHEVILSRLNEANTAMQDGGYFDENRFLKQELMKTVYRDASEPK